MSEQNACLGCAGDLGSTVDEVITHLADHDDVAAERAVSAIAEESVLAILHDLVTAEVLAGTDFEQLPGWVQRRTYAETYSAAVALAQAHSDDSDEAAIAAAENEGLTPDVR